VLTADLCSRSAAGGPVLKGGEASLVGPFAEHLSDLIDARFFLSLRRRGSLHSPVMLYCSGTRQCRWANPAQRHA